MEGTKDEKKNLFMMEDELLAIKERAALIKFMKKKTNTPYSSTIVRRHVVVLAFQKKIDNSMMLAQSKS